MDDLISRQAAINRINKQREYLRPDLYPQDKIGDSAYRICAEFIGRLPSAERRGRWEKPLVGHNRCSVCGALYKTCDDYGNVEDGILDWDYCPICGSFNGEGGENEKL